MHNSGTFLGDSARKYIFQGHSPLHCTGCLNRTPPILSWIASKKSTLILTT
jgi:hypothetical protein